MGRHVHHSVQPELDDGKMTFGGRFSKGFLIFWWIKGGRPGQSPCGNGHPFLESPKRSNHLKQICSGVYFSGRGIRKGSVGHGFI